MATGLESTHLAVMSSGEGQGLGMVEGDFSLIRNVVFFFSLLEENMFICYLYKLKLHN